MKLVQEHNKYYKLSLKNKFRKINDQIIFNNFPKKCCSVTQNYKLASNTMPKFTKET